MIIAVFLTVFYILIHYAAIFAVKIFMGNAYPIEKPSGYYSKPVFPWDYGSSTAAKAVGSNTKGKKSGHIVRPLFYFRNIPPLPVNSQSEETL